MNAKRAALACAFLASLTAAPARADQAAAQLVLSAHNSERARHALAPLHWNDGLAEEAHRRAARLARAGYLEHSAESELGENLWMGTAGAYSLHEMMGDFLSERAQFRPGRFPHVARGGDWSSVGHYTQLIWPGTREVGCAIARARGNDVLVCLYSPAGNIIGARVP